MSSTIGTSLYAAAAALLPPGGPLGWAVAVASVVCPTVSGARGAWATAVERAGAFGMLALVVPACVHAAYWANGALLLVAHERRRRDAAAPTRKRRPPWPRRASLARVAANQCVAACVAGGLAATGLVRVTAVLPPPHELVGHMLALAAAEEVLFYYVHRAFHTVPRLARLHTVHHRHVAPFALAADDCHVVEHVCVNVLPTLAAAPAVGAHAYTLLVWWLLATLQTQENHAAVRLPWQGPGADFHRLHHRHGNVHYGSSGVLDALHGTSCFKKTEGQWGQQRRGSSVAAA